jgi:hypothetical protein
VYLLFTWRRRRLAFRNITWDIYLIQRNGNAETSHSKILRLKWLFLIYLFTLDADWNCYQSGWHICLSQRLSLSLSHTHIRVTWELAILCFNTHRRHFLKIFNLRFWSVCKTCALLDFTNNGRMAYRHIERGKMGSQPLESHWHTHDNPGELLSSRMWHMRPPHTGKQPPSESLP